MHLCTKFTGSKLSERAPQQDNWFSASPLMTHKDYKTTRTYEFDLHTVQTIIDQRNKFVKCQC